MILRKVNSRVLKYEIEKGQENVGLLGTIGLNLRLKGTVFHDCEIEIGDTSGNIGRSYVSKGQCLTDARREENTGMLSRLGTIGFD